MIRRACMVVVAALGCTSSTLPPPVAQVHVGPAARGDLHRVVALPATCGSLHTYRPAAGSQSAYVQASECSDQTLDGVDALVRTLLAFRGLDMVDSETVNATTLKRTAIDTSVRAGRNATESERVELRGSRFADAPPALQDEILEELDADAVLGVRVFVGAGTGISGRRTIEVLVRLHDFRRNELMWASLCRVEAGLVLNGAPIMEAARCAVNAARKL